MQVSTPRLGTLQILSRGRSYSILWLSCCCIHAGTTTVTGPFARNIVAVSRQHVQRRLRHNRSRVHVLAHAAAVTYRIALPCRSYSLDNKPACRPCAQCESSVFTCRDASVLLTCLPCLQLVPAILTFSTADPTAGIAIVTGPYSGPSSWSTSPSRSCSQKMRSTLEVLHQLPLAYLLSEGQLGVLPFQDTILSRPADSQHATLACFRPGSLSWQPATVCCYALWCASEYADSVQISVRMWLQALARVSRSQVCNLLLDDMQRALLNFEYGLAHNCYMGLAQESVCTTRSLHTQILTASCSSTARTIGLVATMRPSSRPTGSPLARCRRNC